MKVVVNPGTEAISGATEEQATSNIQHLVTDLGMDGVHFVRIMLHDYGEGRYAYLMWRGIQCAEVQMPGLPLEQVRFVNAGTQNPWRFPRLYVQRSSWLWKYAADMVRTYLTPTEEP